MKAHTDDQFDRFLAQLKATTEHWISIATSRK